MSKYLTTKQIAKKRGVPVRTVQFWITSGQLKARRMGRDWFVREADEEIFSPRPVGRPAIKT